MDQKNIQNYTGDPDEANDINYSLEQQERRKAIRKLDIETNEISFKSQLQL